MVGGRVVLGVVTDTCKTSSAALTIIMTESAILGEANCEACGGSITKLGQLLTCLFTCVCGSFTYVWLLISLSRRCGDDIKGKKKPAPCVETIPLAHLRQEVRQQQQEQQNVSKN